MEEEKDEMTKKQLPSFPPGTHKILEARNHRQLGNTFPIIMEKEWFAEPKKPYLYVDNRSLPCGCNMSEPVAMKSWPLREYGKLLTGK